MYVHTGAYLMLRAIVREIEMAAEELDKNGIAVGAIFTSFKELQKEIIKYQRENYVQMYRRDSRTIEAAMRRAPNRTFNPRIEYSEVVYSCIHGGKKFKSESKGKRPQQQ